MGRWMWNADACVLVCRLPVPLCSRHGMHMRAEWLQVGWVVCVVVQGTVLIRNAAELENYSRSEEAKLEEYIKAIADAGVKVGWGWLCTRQMFTW